MVVIFNNKDFNRQNMYETLEALYRELEEHSLFIFDLSAIRHLNEETAGSLIFLQGYLKERKKSLRMYQTREQLTSVFEKMNLENVMSMAYRTNSDLNEDENMVFYFK